MALFVLTTVAVSAQESVLLRLNYNKGDKYLMKVEQVQNQGLQIGINMNITMGLNITDASKTNVTLESKITAVKMDVMQGAMNMSYDSSKDDTNLDQGGQAIKAQIDPIMKSTIIRKMNRDGKILDTKIEPANPMLSQFADQNSDIKYPEEKVSVGSEWSEEMETLGAKTTLTYTVTKIEGGIVYVDIAGKVSGSGQGTIKGKVEIDAKTGIQLLVENESVITAGGVESKSKSKVTMTKH